jgi:hypothetical protein
MCISSKGPGYNPADVVKDALKNLQVTVESFFQAAKQHTKSSFEPKAAAVAYLEQKPGYVVPAQVVAFADWVQLKANPGHVKTKYPMLKELPKPPEGVIGLEGEVAVGLA